MNKFHRISYILIFIVISLGVQAQSQKVSYHIVKRGENLSAISRQYKITLSEIMKMNNMNFESRLQVGDSIKVPATAKAQVKPVDDDKQFTVTIVQKRITPVKYVVVKGDNLYQISKRFNVPMEEVKSFNNITDESLKVGQVLIINKPTEEPVKDSLNLPVMLDSTPSDKPATDTLENIINASEKVKAQPEPASAALHSGEEINYEKINTEPIKTKILLQGEKGYFSDEFGKDTEGKKPGKIKGAAMVFKTAAGYDDHKYYILMDNLAPGAIVRITAENGNEVYAKVLWNMENIKENKGIDFRISNATADALGITDQKFEITINYFK